MSTHDPYAALRSHGYRRLLVVHVLTVAHAQMLTTALGWWIYDRTSSAAMLGLSGLLQFLPVLILAIPVGHLIDVYRRRTMLIVGQLLLFCTSITLLACARWHAPLSILFPSILLLGIGNAFSSIARPTLIRDVIGADAAENASFWNMIGRRVTSIAAPAAAGWMISATAGVTTAFAIDAVLIAVAALLTTQLPSPTRERMPAPLNVHSVLEGIRFIRKSPLLLSSTLLDMFAVLVGGATGLLPLFAKDILLVGPVGLGWLTAASPLGQALAAMIMVYRPKFQHAGRSLLLAVMGFGCATIVFGLSRSFALSFVALALIGALDGVSVVVRSTILQLKVPERLRGRVFALNMIFVYSSNELGDFESGMAAALLGPVLAVVTGGLAAIGIAGYFALAWPQLRKLGPMTESEEMLEATS